MKKQRMRETLIRCFFNAVAARQRILENAKLGRAEGE